MSKENTNSRNQILTSIRRSLETSKGVKNYHPHQYKSFVEPRIITQIPVLAGFIEALEAVGGKCFVAKSKKEAGKKISEIIEICSAEKVAVSNSELVKKVIPKGLEVSENPGKDDLFDYDLGISSAQMAIAETGTLVLESESENNRLVSLIPPVHLCILEKNMIRQTLGDVLMETRQNLSKTITFITGPSRTSDIELTLAIGVHGPRQLFVIVIE